MVKTRKAMTNLNKKAWSIAVEEGIYANDRSLEEFMKPLFECSLDIVFQFCIFKDKRHPEKELAYAAAYVTAKLMSMTADNNEAAGYRYIMAESSRKCNQMESQVISRLNYTAYDNEAYKNRSVYDAVSELGVFRGIEGRVGANMSYEKNNKK